MGLIRHIREDERLRGTALLVITVVLCGIVVGAWYTGQSSATADDIPPTQAPAIAIQPTDGILPTWTATPLPPSMTWTLPPSLTPLPTVAATDTPIPPTPTPPPSATFTPLPTLTFTPDEVRNSTQAPTITPAPILPDEILPTFTATVTVTATQTAIIPTSTPTLTPTATVLAEGDTVHIVVSGETLFGIATAYGVSMEQIAAANGISDPELLYAGQELLIPGGANGAIVQTVGNDDLGIVAPPLPQAGGITLNGLTVDAMLIMPPEVRQNMREIYARGVAMGRNPQAFSKVGDSTIENPHFLARFDSGPYILGDYDYLQPVIDYYNGSFSRQGMAVRRGMHSWNMLDAMWVGNGCLGGESPLTCEFRLHNPSVVIIRLGSNDVGVPQSFANNMREIVAYCIENGVVPIIGTKADRNEGGNNINNNIIRDIAAEFAIPLWEYDIVAGTIPGRGLGGDGVHMTTYFAHDWTLPAAFQTGHGVHNISALMVLDGVWRVLVESSQ